MTSASFHLTGVMLAVGLASCAPPPAPPANPAVTANPAVAAKPAPAVKRPVLMVGRGKVSSISMTDLFALQQSGNVLLFDARPAFFYNLGHIPGAISLPKTHCDEEIDRREGEIKAAIAANKPIVVYCTNLLCSDAGTVAIHLAGRGYPSSTMGGGWDAWKEAGLPTE